MRRVVATEYMTLDGVMESPNRWSFQFWSDEAAQFKLDELLASDALLLGRVTYEGFAAAWPSMTDDAGFADRMNSLPKFVVSSTLDEPEWNNSTLIKGDVAEAVTQLKRQPGQDILLAGSADLVDTLRRHNLIDEYRIMLHPVVVGSGKRLFRDGTATTSLRLVDTKRFGSGIIVLYYEPTSGG
ncbi:MAG: dihydrofolate reductase family protein [Ktedonobacterales bacterium]